MTGDGLLGPVQWPLSWRLPRAWNPCCGIRAWHFPPKPHQHRAQRPLKGKYLTLDPATRTVQKVTSYSYLEELEKYLLPHGLLVQPPGLTW